MEVDKPFSIHHLFSGKKQPTFASPKPEEKLQNKLEESIQDKNIEKQKIEKPEKEKEINIEDSNLKEQNSSDKKALLGKNYLPNPFSKFGDGIQFSEEDKETDKQKVDCDTYLCFSITMPELYIIVISPFILLKMTIQYFQSLYYKFKDENKIMILCGCIFSPLFIIFGITATLLMFCLLLVLVVILLLPGFVTPAIQLVFLNYIISEVESEFEESTGYLQNVMVMKGVVIFLLLFMVTNEANQAINSFIFTSTKAKNKCLFYMFLCFFPQIIQIGMTFILFYVSIFLIAISETSIDLIQNFAGLYILLDLDIAILQFLRTTRFTSIILAIKKFSKKLLSQELEGVEVFEFSLVQEVFEEGEVEFDLIEEKEKGNKFIKCKLLFLRFLGILALFALLVYTWLTIVYDYYPQ